MTAGRPTKYEGEETCKKVQEYLAMCQWHTLPTVEGLALELGISRSKLYEWQHKYPEFGDSVERVLLTQADKLINKSLLGTYNTKVSMMMLSNHGYREVVETNANITVAEGPRPLQSIREFIEPKFSIRPELRHLLVHENGGESDWQVEAV
jgi:DNA-packaging protein gp3